MFAERYSMGIDDFYALTLRQIVQIKRVIERKKLIDREWQAMLADKKLKQTMQPLNIKPEEREEFDKQAQRLYDRMKRDYELRSRTTDKN